MARGIACKTCGATFGSVEAPDSATLRDILGKMHLSALAKMLPKDATETLATTLTFECGACIMKRG